MVLVLCLLVYIFAIQLNFEQKDESTWWQSEHLTICDQDAEKNRRKNNNGSTIHIFSDCVRLRLICIHAAHTCLHISYEYTHSM